MAQLPSFADPDLLVGTSTADDAAVYQISPEIALVQTVDFFTPVVDDPYDFGRISAANSLSDIYAMGATPRIAMNVVGFPVSLLPLDYLVEILRGGAAVAHEAGVTIVGGHTIDDREPKYGLAATGILRPGAQITNATARVGDVLVLTKPLGTGVIATAIKRGVAAAGVIATATESMATLNKDAAMAALDNGVSSMTDVTGFGLLGHLSEMCTGSAVSAELWVEALPFLPGAVDLAREGVVPGGTRRNLDYVTPFLVWEDPFEEWEQLLVADAQTSGGLLISLPAERSAALVERLRSTGGLASAEIGRILPRGDVTLHVRRMRGKSPVSG